MDEEFQHAYASHTTLVSFMYSLWLTVVIEIHSAIIQALLQRRCGCIPVWEQEMVVPLPHI
jgi:hypothetical protein